ncbi:hypothetical protein [Companilactobacillus nodensis]|uniref:hypothetical protein n=1 Tax=Companilactobacillus nodensis TaxID=460870 RepID=UPI000469F64C|nr:hypothetical protein [Companilactobacillus nodensis]
MKRKIWSIITAILLLLLVSGCSPKRVAKTSHTRSETSYYQDLSKMDRNKVNFKFKATEDESTASDTTNYLVDMTIKNTSKTNVKFNLSKFVMLNPYDDSTKVTSSKKNTVIVKPGQSKIINSIFEKVSKDILDGQGAYYYLNKDYKLAYFYKSYNGNGVTSDNLKSGPARKFNIKKHESVVKNTTDTDNTQNQNINQQATSNDISNTQQNSTQSTDTSSQNIITTESQAIGLFKHMWGMEARDDFAAYPVDGASLCTPRPTDSKVLTQLFYTMVMQYRQTVQLQNTHNFHDH